MFPTHTNQMIIKLVCFMLFVFKAKSTLCFEVSSVVVYFPGVIW